MKIIVNERLSKIVESKEIGKDLKTISSKKTDFETTEKARQYTKDLYEKMQKHIAENGGIQSKTKDVDTRYGTMYCDVVGNELVFDAVIVLL